MRETAEKQAFKLNPTGSLVRSKSDPKLPNRENDRRGVQHWQSLERVLRVDQLGRHAM